MGNKTPAEKPKKGTAKKQRTASASSNTSAGAANATPDPLAHLQSASNPNESTGFTTFTDTATHVPAAAPVAPVTAPPTVTATARATASPAVRATPGLINQRHNHGTSRKMTWTAANDRKLLLLALGREIRPHEYATIAASFPENPTPKAIQERLTKLRREQGIEIDRLDLSAPEMPIHPVNREDEGVKEDDADAPPPIKTKSKRHAEDDAPASSSRPSKKPKRGPQPTAESVEQVPETEEDLRENAMLANETRAAFPINRPRDISIPVLMDLVRVRVARIHDTLATLQTGGDQLEQGYDAVQRAVQRDREARRGQSQLAIEEAGDENLDEEAGEEDAEGDVENEDSDKEYEDSEGHAELYD